MIFINTNNISYIEEKLKDTDRPKKKTLFPENIGPQTQMLFLVPKENKILRTILEDEIDLFKFFLSEYKLDGEYVEDENGEIHVDVAEGIEEEIFIFENVLKKIKEGFGLDFLPRLEKQELGHLVRAIEHKLVVFDFDDMDISIKKGRKFKKDIEKIHEKIMPYLDKKQ